MAYKIFHEGERFPVLHIEPALADGEAVHGHGPFSPAPTRELIREVIAVAHARCLVLGCAAPAGRQTDTWRIHTMIPARDLEPLTAAFKAFLQDGDDGALRRYVTSPPGLRPPPRRVAA